MGRSQLSSEPPSSTAPSRSPTRSPSKSTTNLPSSRASSWVVSAMQQIASQCSNCGAFTRRSLHHEEEYHSSAFLQRLRTSNFPATDEEITHIRHTILPAVSDDILSIDSKLASLRNEIMSMEEERERLLNVQKKYSNLISLHRALPLEIWSEIFLYTLRSPFYSNAFDASSSIWQLSHVCQRWRNVALSLQSFWSTMDIDFPQAAQCEADVERLKAVIQRSRQGLLNIDLNDDELTTPHSKPSILQRMLDIVLAESYRWREFGLSDGSGGFHSLYASLPHRLPRLETVRLYCVPPTGLYKYSALEYVFKDCPHLTKLTLCEGSLGVVFPWAQITELELSPMDLEFDDEEEGPREWMRLIGRCTSLEILSMPDWDFDDDENETTYTPITLSKMIKLDVMSVPVVNALTLPLLREASLHADPAASHYDSLYSLKQLLIRSNCMNGLTSLSLTKVPLGSFPERTLHSILSQTHSLASLNLTINMQTYDDQMDVNDRDQILLLVNSLKVIPTETVTFLPLLSSLDIRIYNYHTPWSLECFGPVGSFASALRTRWKGNDTVGLVRLRRCHFVVHTQYLQEVVNRARGGSIVPHIFDAAERSVFNALIDDGMDLVVQVKSEVTPNTGGNRVVFAACR